MFVSILQRLGFKGSQRSGEPLQSRADQNTRTTRSDGRPGTEPSRKKPYAEELPRHKQAGSKGRKESESRPMAVKGTHDNNMRDIVTVTPPEAGPQAASDRRQIVKAPAKKLTVAAQAAAKPAVKAKAVSKPVQPVKPAGKSAKAVNTVASAAKKTASVSKSSPVVPKEVRAKAARPVVATKAIAGEAKKAVLEPAVKSPAKVVPPVKTSKAPAPVKTALASKPAQADMGKKPVLPAAAPAPKPAVSSVERSTPMTSPPALKPGRRSSARAPSQLPPPAPMVPTHAPDAAKASYSTMTERVIAPPPHVAAKKDPKLANNWKTKAAEELTDDEVKAMPDTEYMNEKQLAFFRFKLSVLKQEIHNSAGETTEHLREDTVVVPDPADRATIEEEHALELRTRDRERKLLKKIEQSIARIDSGDYGYCDETGEPIGVGRLIARPTANLSLEAQQRRELKQKMFGD